MPLKVLLLENSEADALLLVDKIEQAGFILTHDRVYTKQRMLNVLHQESDWDIIISEHNMPGFTSTDALLVLLERGIETPLIIISDHISEEVAIQSVRAGAHDFLTKDNLSRLGVAITHALQASQARVEAKAYQQRLRELSIHLEEVREKERIHIAREVHDELGGMLTAIKMDISWLHKKSSDCNCNAEEKFTHIGESVDSAINTVRRIITDLRPSVLDDLGLVAALEWQLSEFENRTHITCLFYNQAPTIHIEDKNHEVAIFRIFQQSLTNISWHARASRVEVSLAFENGSLLLEIIDNGIGISEENLLKRGHYGILAMHERLLCIGGNLEVSAAETAGTRVTLRLPFETRDK